MITYEKILGYDVRMDVAYDPSTDLWIETASAEFISTGLDPLGAETTGTLAQLSLLPPGSTVKRGEAVGSLEAEKFVGPLLSPVSGTIVDVNPNVLANPALVHHDPYGTWLVRIEPSDLENEMSQLVKGDAISQWFTSKVEDYRRRGVLAE